MSNKSIATSFLQTAAMGSAREAYDMFVAPHFIHHNQYFKGDRTSLLSAMEEAAKLSPNLSFSIKQTLEDGDRVVTHSHVIKENLEIAVVHIFRFEEGKIVELWDLGQVFEKESPNENGLF